MKNMAVWFDIPVKDIDRAMKFYSKVFAIELTKMEGAPMGYALFPHDENNVSGGLVEDPDTVTNKGSLLYLNGGDNLATPLSKVEEAGGKITQVKTSIGEHGFMAKFLDTEGNTIAVHSMK